MTVRLTVAAARSCELRERFVYSLACCTKREGVCALRGAMVRERFACESNVLWRVRVWERSYIYTRALTEFLTCNPYSPT